MKYHFIVLAAGFSRRFEGNKLLYPYEGKALYRHALDRLIDIKKNGRGIESLVLVTQYDEIISETEDLGIPCIRNERSEDGISSSLKLGIQRTDEVCGRNCDSGSDAYVFFVADPPFLTEGTVKAFLETHALNPSGITCVRNSAGKKGNPVAFSGIFREELLGLSGDVGGKQVMQRHPEAVRLYTAPDRELEDIDTRDQMAMLNRIKAIKE